jgi:hypothetical protein
MRHTISPGIAKEEIKAMRILGDCLLAIRAYPTDADGNPWVHGWLMPTIGISCPVCQTHTTLSPWSVNLRSKQPKVRLGCGCEVVLRWIKPSDQRRSLRSRLMKAASLLARNWATKR